MYRILLIRPEPEGLACEEEATLIRFLTDSGLTIKVAPLGGITEGRETLCYSFDGKPPNVLIVDLTAPASVLAGVLPLRHIHRIQKEAWGDDAVPLPLILLLTQTQLHQRDWFTFADDFLLPPHPPDEMITRIRLLLFRRQHIAERDRLQFNDITLYLSEGRAVGRNNDPLFLTPKEFALLRFLLTHRGRFFSRERLIDFVWGVDFEGGPRTVDIHIRRLRMKLPPSVSDLLENRRNVGYGFNTGASENGT
jgi:DNA-binding response OmpR family regulator